MVILRNMEESNLSETKKDDHSTNNYYNKHKLNRELTKLLTIQKKVNVKIAKIQYFAYQEETNNKLNLEENARKRKKPHYTENCGFRRPDSEDIARDVEKLRDFFGPDIYETEAGCKISIVKFTYLKKNDQVYIAHYNIQEKAIVNWSNSEEIVLRRMDGRKIKFTIKDLNDGFVKIYKIKNNYD